MINIVLGAPGTGKTTYLLSKVEEYLQKSSPKNIGFISFTKKSVAEGKARACEKFRIDSKELVYFRTIHSLAFFMLGATSIELLTNYKEFSETIGIEIKGNKISTDEQWNKIVPGDQMLFLNSLSRLTMIPAINLFNAYPFDFSMLEYAFFEESLRDYKKAKMVYDFTDLLEKYYNQGARPSLDLLIVDEAQDLCTLQWRIVEELIKYATTTFIGGDDDQAIFRWAGADVKHFIDLSKRHKTIILNQSYRLPKQVHALALSISGTISNRVPKVFNATAHEGNIHYVNDIEELPMETGKWLILYRNNYMTKEVVSFMRSSGYFYEIIGDTEEAFTFESLQAALLWEKLRGGGVVSFPELKTIIHYMDNNVVQKKKNIGTLQKDKVYNLENLRQILGITTNEIWHKALNKISAEDREYYIAARRQGESLIGKPRIRLSTIHSVKGGEEDNVVLYTDISAKVHNTLCNNRDDEMRVLYVGVTRTKQNLYFITPKTKYYYDI